MPDSELAAALSAYAARLAGATAGPVQVISHRADGGSGALVVRCGSVVVKAHDSRTDPAALACRVAAMAAPAALDVLLAPSEPRVASLAGRAVTVWPAGEPVANPESVPWSAAGELLARLHRIPLAAVPALPSAGGPRRLARAIRDLRSTPATEPAAAAPVLAAYRALRRTPPSRRSFPGVLVHGDWHLGQLLYCEPPGRWLLTDPDDLGAGDPAWDLGRPAAWFAVGMLEPESWAEFLGAYREAGGPAVPATGDPWPGLDRVARALTIQLAAQGVVTAAREGRDLDEAEELPVAACGRMLSLDGGS
jgi:aminoglycoside phosphotransferase (APT) family kinase protein